VCCATPFAAYFRFYAPAHALSGSVRGSDLDDVVADFGSVIRGLNARFARHLGVVGPKPNMRRCFALIKQRGHCPNGCSASNPAWSPSMRCIATRTLLAHTAMLDAAAWGLRRTFERSKEALREQWQRRDLARLRKPGGAHVPMFRTERLPRLRCCDRQLWTRPPLCGALVDSW